MTIITKPNSNKTFSKAYLKEKDESDGKGVDVIPIPENDGDEVEIWTSPNLHFFVRRGFFIFLSAIIILSFVLVFLFCYQHSYAQSSKSQFRGWCGVPFERNDLHFNAYTGIPPPGFASVRKEKKEDDLKEISGRISEKEWFSHGMIKNKKPLPDTMFKELFDMDLSSQMYMKVYVPDFGYGISTQFIHDFSVNKTGIVLHGARKCYIMPLDRSHIKPPRAMFDLIRKMWLGTYDVDTRVIRRRMRVVYPELDQFELSGQGKHIQSMCSDYNTHFLEEIEVQRLKRSSKKELNIAEFAGNNVVEFSISE